MKITIIGTGAYGIGIALMLAKKNENNIMMWTENKELAKDFREKRKFGKIFPDVEVPNNISLTESYEEALKDTGLIFLITSAKYILNVCKEMLPYYTNTPICIASKGIEHTTLSTLSKIGRASCRERV